MTAFIQASAQVYFKEKTVADYLAKNNRKSLERAGLYVTTLAKNSIKKRLGKSFPGQPPISRTGKLKNMLGYGLSPNGQTAISGALLREDVTRANVASALEHGGSMRDKRTNREIAIAQRPFMSTALIQSKDMIAKFFDEKK